MATMKTNKPPDGYLFAIVNSLESVIQLGMKVSSSHNVLRISLVYNDPSTNTPLESLVAFNLPYEPKHWISFAIQVMNDKISLYHNCVKVQEVNVTKEPQELVFESASTFYLAQAGNSKHNFEVSPIISNGSLKFVIETICENLLRDREISFRCTPNCVPYYLPGKTKQLPRRERTHARCRSLERH